MNFCSDGGALPQQDCSPITLGTCENPSPTKSKNNFELRVPNYHLCQLSVLPVTPISSRAVSQRVFQINLSIPTCIRPDKCCAPTCEHLRTRPESKCLINSLPPCCGPRPRPDDCAPSERFPPFPRSSPLGCLTTTSYLLAPLRPFRRRRRDCVRARAAERTTDPRRRAALHRCLLLLRKGNALHPPLVLLSPIFALPPLSCPRRRTTPAVRAPSAPRPLPPARPLHQQNLPRPQKPTSPPHRLPMDPPTRPPSAVPGRRT